MFDILFGWRKASKCKRLIRRLQCRLKILKNKRSSIAKQLRDDVAELLKHGHVQTAFDRVEQLFKDECLVAVYDLLDSFGEFVISNLHYIRRNRDCPNDIKEAVSSLIFSSARFGDLPELIAIRELFGERYGQRFATVATELLPGNLVNRQVQEKVCIKSVSRDKKCRLVEEILKGCLQSGPLLLEYSSELHQKMENTSCIDPIPGAKTTNQDENQNQEDILTTSPRPSNCSETSRKSSAASSVQKINRQVMAPVKETSLTLYDSGEEGNASSESSAWIYVDDIQELEKKSLVDQRVFMFRTCAVAIRGKTDIKSKKQEGPEYQKSSSTKRLRTRSVLSLSGTNDLQDADRKTTPIEEPAKTQEDKASHIRAMSMPLARPQDTCTDPVHRSNSVPFRQHVHPNLPDYDELAATFIALKGAILQGKKL